MTAPDNSAGFAAFRGAAAVGPREGRLCLRLVFAAVLLPAMLAACTVPGEPGGFDVSSIGTGNLEAFDPPTEPYRAGAIHFRRGEYGLSERFFREATEKAPKDAASWIGLAASYDRLSRFDLADNAYHTAIAISGETVQILNNQGYSYLLRGNLSAARAKFAKARDLEPDNPLVQNNMLLLEGGARFIKPKAG